MADYSGAYEGDPDRGKMQQSHPADPGPGWDRRTPPPVVPHGTEEGFVHITNIDPAQISSSVVHPSHYGGKNNLYEVRKVIRAWGLGFNLGNAVKYIGRAGKKDPSKHIEDLEKAIFYLQDEISYLQQVDKSS